MRIDKMKRTKQQVALLTMMLFLGSSQQSFLLQNKEGKTVNL